MNSNYDFSVINTLRKKLNFTLQKLADSAGLTYPTVETIETNKKIPSLRTLDALAGALRVTSSELLSMAEKRLVQKRTAEKIITDKLNPDKIGLNDWALTIYDKAKVLRIDAKKDAAIHYPELHEESHEICYVLKGKLSLRVEDQDYHLVENESLLFDGVLDHKYTVMEDGEFLAIHIPKDIHIIEALLKTKIHNQ